jgi:hypothetical protein
VGDFVCDVCNCICNTARGHYFAKDLITYSPETKGKALCWFCLPKDQQEDEDWIQWKPKHKLPLWDGDSTRIANR